VNACFVWTSSGIVLMPDSPVLMPRPSSDGCDCAQYGIDSTIMKVAPTISHAHGRPITARVTVSQNPPGRPCSTLASRRNHRA
jgi:hypothetical protein